ncbi:MAG: cytochrome c [Crocinitomicaceae bacterium]|nr:cytochrome c [Crocinitomicaceae bacterium]
MKKLVLLLSIGSTLLACSPKTGEIVKLERTTIMTPSADLANGFELYQSNCGGCHELKNELAYSKEQWQVILPKMAKEARLDASQEKSISNYVYWRINQK